MTPPQESPRPLAEDFPPGSTVTNGYSVRTVAGHGERWCDGAWRRVVLYEGGHFDRPESLTLLLPP
jgi:hypothetical protein